MLVRPGDDGPSPRLMAIESVRSGLPEIIDQVYEIMVRLRGAAQLRC